MTELLANEDVVVVVVAMAGRPDCSAEKLEDEKSLGSWRGEVALMDSIDVAGDTPSEVYERRLVGWLKRTMLAKE